MTHTEIPVPVRAHVVDLDRGDAEQVRALAAALGSGQVDDPGWLAETRDHCGALPGGFARALRRFRADPGQAGLLVARGLPVGTPGPTPVERGSVERGATVSATTLLLAALTLGEVAAFRPEKSGALVQNVVPVPGQEREQSNAGSTPLTMHVENAFHPHRPDFVLLLCVRGDHEGVAGLTVASIREALGLIDAHHRTVLGEPRFRTAAPPSFGGGGADQPPHAVLTGAPEDPDIKVDFAATTAHDGAGTAALAALQDALLTVRQVHVLSAGDLAVVDNRVALHGRTAFTPRYDGHDRWLQRAFVHQDHRRTRACRVGGGHVLV